MRSQRTVPRSRSPLRPPAWLLCALLVPFVATVTQAHRPNESTAQLRWEHQRLEAELVLSVPLASLILGVPETPLITSDNFPAVHDRLLRRLTETFRVEEQARVIAHYDRLNSLSFTADGDIRCVLVFPAESSSQLRVHAAFLQQASPDSFCWLRVWSGPDRLLAQKLLVRSEPRSDVAADSPAPTAPTSTTNATAPPKP